MVTTRILDPEETQRAIDAGGPLAEVGATAEGLKEMRVAVAEVDGAIVAYWVVWYALHIEPLWIHPDHRRAPRVVAGIVQEMERLVGATGEPSAFAVLEQENVDLLARAAMRLGFHEAPGKLYYVVVQPPVEAVTR